MIVIVFLLTILSAGCSDDDNTLEKLRSKEHSSYFVEPGESTTTVTITEPEPSSDKGKNTDLDSPVVYVFIITHVEEPDGTSNNPDFVADEDVFHFQRSMVLEYAEMLYNEGAKLNYQSDWNFLQAMLLYDDGENTNGKNLAQYLAEDLHFAVDPHAHESKYNYADVAYLITQVLEDDSPPQVAGGGIYYPISSSKIDHLNSKIQGKVYDYTWSPDILLSGGTLFHQGEDAEVSGVWNPASSKEYFTHDENKAATVGTYTGDVKGILYLLELAQKGELDSNKIYTASLNYHQRNIDSSADIEEIRKEIELIKEADEGHIIVFATMQEIVEDWKEKYNSAPNILYAENYDVPGDWK